jgi:hypothetical protein
MWASVEASSRLPVLVCLAAWALLGAAAWGLAFLSFGGLQRLIEALV